MMRSYFVSNAMLIRLKKLSVVANIQVHFTFFFMVDLRGNFLPAINTCLT